MAKRYSDGVNRRVDIDKSEQYLKGHRGGVEGTYGEPHDGVAEKTIWQGEGDSDGGGEDGLGACASNLYQRARKNGGSGDGMGDQALVDR